MKTTKKKFCLSLFFSDNNHVNYVFLKVYKYPFVKWYGSGTFNRYSLAGFTIYFITFAF